MAWLNQSKPPFSEQALDLARYILTDYGDQMADVSTSQLSAVIETWMAKYIETKTVGSRTIASEFNG